MNTRITDGKTYAEITDLRLWPKNPRKVEDKDLSRLTGQIQNLGLYKPLVVTPDGEVLGGNQRFKVLKEIHDKDNNEFHWVWVSVVEAWRDEDRLKYALSDNDSIGKYTREGLKEVLGDFVNQKTLFSDYSLDIDNKESVENFIADLTVPELEYQFKFVKKQLESMGINKETVDVLESMAVNNKINDKIPDVDIKGCVQGQKFPVMFWLDDEKIYEQLNMLFDSGHKNERSTPKLLEMINKLGIALPCTEDDLLAAVEYFKELTKGQSEIDSMNDNGIYDKEKQTFIEKKQETLAKIKDLIKKLNILEYVEN